MRVKCVQWNFKENLFASDNRPVKLITLHHHKYFMLCVFWRELWMSADRVAKHKIELIWILALWLVKLYKNKIELKSRVDNILPFSPNGTSFTCPVISFINAISLHPCKVQRILMFSAFVVNSLFLTVIWICQFLLLSYSSSLQWSWSVVSAFAWNSQNNRTIFTWAFEGISVL